MKETATLSTGMSFMVTVNEGEKGDWNQPRIRPHVDEILKVYDKEGNDITEVYESLIETVDTKIGYDFEESLIMKIEEKLGL